MQGVMNVKIKDEIMKCFIFTAISAGISILTLFADPIDVPSEYDATTETWIGSVAALTNALKTCKAGDTIRLARGVYDVTSLTNMRRRADGRRAG